MSSCDYTDSIRETIKDQRLGTGVPPYDYYVENLKQCVDRKSGISMPDFRQRIRRHQSATGSYEREIIKVDSRGGTFGVKLKGYGGGTVTTVQRTWRNPLQSWASSINLNDATYNSQSNSSSSRASAKFWRKVESQRMSGLTFLGELKDTVRMLRRPYVSLYEGASRYLRELASGVRRFKSTADISRFVGDTWLETAFGWKPLLSDTAAIIDLIAKVQNQKNYRKITSYDEATWGQATSRVQGSSPGYASGALSFVVSNVEERSVMTKYVGELVTCSYLDSPLERTKDLARFHLDEVIPTAWELLPWSFLIDYFVNVGDILNATALAHTSAFSWTSLTTVRRFKRTSVIVPDIARMRSYWGSYFNGTFGGELRSRFSQLSMSRTTGGIPPPEFRAELPLRLKPALNMLALFLASSRVSPLVNRRYTGEEYLSYLERRYSSWVK